MAITPYGPDAVTGYIGLSSDTKPTPATPGSTFFETDTGGFYVTNGSTWSALPSLGAPGGGDASAANQAVTNTDLGAPGDALVAAGAVGSASAKLRRLTTDLAAFLAANHTDLAALATQTTSAAILAALVEGGEIDLDLDQIHADLAALLTGIALAPSESHLGAVGGQVAVVKVTPTLTVHASYASGDYVGTSATPMTFAGMARINGGSGEIKTAQLIDFAANVVASELWLFDTAITPPADSAAWSISDADAAHLVGVVPLSTYYASALNAVAVAANVGLIYKCAVADTALYGCLVTRGTPTYADGDVSVVLKAKLN